MHNDIGAITDWLNQHWRCNGVIHNEWHAVRMRYSGDCFNINDIACRVSNRLTEDGCGLIIDQSGEGLGSIILSKPDVDTLLWEHVRKQGVSPAIELRWRNNIFSGFSEGQNRIVDRGATSADGERSNATLEISYPLL